MAMAIEEVELGEYQRIAAENWNVLRTTLRRRLHGGITR
jgi:hypothetical protein